MLNFTIYTLCTQPSLSQLDTVSPDVGCEGLTRNIATLDDVFFLSSQEPDVHRFRFAFHIYRPSVLEMELWVCVTWPTQVPENWNIYWLSERDYCVQIRVAQRAAQVEKLKKKIINPRNGGFSGLLDEHNFGDFLYYSYVMFEINSLTPFLKFSGSSCTDPCLHHRQCFLVENPRIVFWVSNVLSLGRPLSLPK